MDLDARHRRIDRCSLEVEEPDRGRSDEDDLALEAAGIGRSRQHILRRNKAGFVVRAEMNPELPTPIGRNLEPSPAKGDALNARLVHLDPESRPRRSPPAATLR